MGAFKTGYDAVNLHRRTLPIRGSSMVISRISSTTPRRVTRITPAASQDVIYDRCCVTQYTRVSTA